MTSWIFTSRSSSVAAETASWNKAGRDSAANETKYLRHSIPNRVPNALFFLGDEDCVALYLRRGICLSGTDQHTDNVTKAK